MGHHCGIGKRSLAVGLPGVDVYTRTLLLEPTIRAANGMDRVHCAGQHGTCGGQGLPL